MTTTMDPIGDALRSAESLLKLVTKEPHPLPDLTHPRARQYATLGDLLIDLKPGDQIAVRGGTQPHSHHGVFVGIPPGRSAICVVDLNGSKKHDSTVRVRNLGEFVKGADVFAKIDWDDAPRTLEESTNVALAAAEYFERNAIGSVYHITKFNCESFATECRTGWCVSDSARSSVPTMSVSAALANMVPLPPPPPAHDGFKGWSWWFSPIDGVC